MVVTPTAKPNQIPALERAINAELCRRSYYEFFLEFWETVSPHKLINNFHLKVLCDELQILGEAVIAGKIPPHNHLIINIPPGMSKSTICTQLFPAWLWCRNPKLKIIVSSYSATLALDHTSKIRSCLKSDKYQSYYGHLFKISEDADSKIKTGNNKMGTIFGISEGGAGTGRHGDIVIVDDPHKPPNYETGEAGAANTEIARQVQWHWNALDSRKVDETRNPTILVMQRLHSNDLSGDMMKKAESGGIKLRHLRLPCSDDYPINPPELAAKYKQNGGLLDPIRRGREFLTTKKIRMGNLGFAPQYGQDATPDEGGVFKKDWWGYYRELPADAIIYATMDTAIGDKSSKNRDNTDPYGLLLVAHSRSTNNLYGVAYLEFKMEFPDVVTLLTDGAGVVSKSYPDQYALMISNLAPKYRERFGQEIPVLEVFGFGSNSVFVIENQTTGIQIRQTLRQATSTNKYNVRGSNTGNASKLDRAKLQSPKIQDGRFLLPEGEIEMRINLGKDSVLVKHVEPWVKGFIDIIAQFPNAAHDEAVDCIEMACRNLLSW